MQKGASSMRKLGISADKVCAFIEFAREVAGLEITAAGDATTSGEDGPFEDMIAPAAGMSRRRREMVAFIAGLDAGEQLHLLALIMVGRGDYAIEEWEDAFAAARDGIADRSADFMIGDSALPDYLTEALEAFDESCE
jgi:hypothetical protein